jgi:DNA anti-recombination protein RmuC
MVFFLALIAGFLFGGAIVWLVQRSDVRQSYDRARGEFSAELAGAAERVRSHEVRITELRAELEQRQQAVVQAPEIHLPDWNEVLQPLKDSIQGVESRVREMQAAFPAEETGTEEFDTLRKELGRLHDDVQAVRDLGSSVYEALLIFGERFASIGKSLEIALDSHNEAAAHLESRVMSAARQFQRSAPLPASITADLAQVVDGVGTTNGRVTVNVQ